MQNIDLLLVEPHQPRTAEILSQSTGITPPHGIGYIASYLEKHGFTIKILDNSIERLSTHEFNRYIKKNNPRYVGFSVCTSSYKCASKLAVSAKQANPDISVLMGGVHASALPRQVISNPAVDIVVKGEGEETTLDLLKTLSKNGDLRNVQGIVFKEGDKIIETPPRKIIEDIDSLSMPAYHLMPMDKYLLPAPRSFTQKRVSSIITSRGCPYGCLFCSSKSVFPGSVRLRSPENVINEIKHLIDRYKIKELVFWDDSFLLDRARAIRICNLMIKEKIKLIWSCSSRVDQISDGTARLFYEAGCRFMLFGVESGSQEVLDRLKKKTTLSQIENAVLICKKNKILSFCSFILGTPYDTRESSEQTIRFTVKLNPDFAIFCIFTPLPGSALFDEYSQGQNSQEVDWDNYVNLLSTAAPAFNNSRLTKKEIIYFQKKAFRTFYFRVSFLRQRLAGIRSWWAIYQLWRGFKSILKIEIHRFLFN